MKGGLAISCGQGQRSYKVEGRIDIDNAFTEVIDSAEISISGPELALVSVSGNLVDYIGIARPGNLVATGQKKILVANLIKLRIPINEITAQLPPRFVKYAGFLETGTRRVSLRTWEETIKVIKASSRSARRAIDNLQKRLEAMRNTRAKISNDIELYERDAIACAVETWGGARYRKRLLREADIPSTSSAPFITRLQDVPIREDVQIQHDHATFPGMEVARRNQVGEVVMENYTERLTIINCNRQPLEETLGVDLIYYNHRYQSFVMVQYKRMLGKSGRDAGYRPSGDKSHNKEISRMLDIEKLLKQKTRQAADSVNDFRLTSHPFYFKLCSHNSYRATDESMVQGMYIPLTLWRRLLKSERTIGPKGGRIFNWDNCDRHFSNTQFTALLRNGWIGSSVSQSACLGSIIESTLSANHMVLYAATQKSPHSYDYLRDEYGRFASEGDPLASR